MKLVRPARLLALGVSAATLACVCGPWLACSDQISHVYLGRPYEETRDCLGDTTAVDVVAGGDTTLGCAPVCIVSPPDIDGGTEVFTSDQCAPYPTLYDLTGKDPRCAKALAALARNDICYDDGPGSSDPADAGAE